MYICPKCESKAQLSIHGNCLICGTKEYHGWNNPLITIKRKDGKIVTVRAATIRVRKNAIQQG